MGDDLFTITGITLAWLGVILAALALFYDWVIQRFKKRRRCPRCWYDMSRSPSLTCSECGYTAKKERKLFKARRRWRWVGLAVLLLIGGYALRVTPDVKDRGWVAAVPTTAIVLALPWLESPDFMGFTTTGTTMNWRQRLFHELRSSRLDSNRMRSWQVHLAATRCMSGDSDRPPLSPTWHDTYWGFLDQLHDLCTERGWPARWEERARRLVRIDVSNRPSWPIGTPIHAFIIPNRGCAWSDFKYTFHPVTSGLRPIFYEEHTVRWASIWRHPARCEDENLFELGTPDEPTDQLVYDVTIEEIVVADDGSGETTRPVKTLRLEIPMRVEGEVASVVHPIQSVEIEQALREHASPTIGSLDYDQDFFLMGRPEREITDELAALGDMTLALELEFRKDGELLATARAWYAYAPDGEFVFFDPYCNLEDALSELPIEDGDDGAGWTVTLRGDPTTALFDFRSDRCWEGEVTLPLTIEIEE